MENLVKYLYALLIAALFVVVPTQANASRGGSNFMFYKVDGCTREPYGVLKNYHTAKADIDAVLHAMRAAGQSRLRIPISHLRGAVGGTNMDSSGGNLAPQYRENLANLLATIKADGFSEVIVGFNT